MRYLHRKYIISMLLLLLATVAKPAIIIDLSPGVSEYNFLSSKLQFFEDSSRKLTFHDIHSTQNEALFKPIGEYPIPFLHPNKVYWVRIDLSCKKKNYYNQFVIEFFDYRIDHLDIYIPDEKQRYFLKTAGFSYPFAYREFKHRNLVFQLPFVGKNITTVYAKIEASIPVTLQVKVATIQSFNDYSLKEYFLLSLYYGICIAMILYNLFLFITIKDKTYLFYIYYVLGAVLFSSAKDGLGFQFLWPNFPVANNYIFNFSNLLMIFWEVMYARSFLNTAKSQPLIDIVLKWILATRIAIYLITTFILPQYSNQVAYDMLTLFVVFCAGVASYRNNYRPAYYYLLAFICMLSGYSIFVITNMGIIKQGVLSLYSINFGLVGEMLLLSFALASRIKILQREKILAQNETIKQLVVNEELKDSLYKELELKVLERTKELENKNKELDAFVYKSSHDLKGPLNSISGLATIGMMEDDVPKMKEYFRLTRDTTRRLQSTIVDLLSLTKVKETTITKKKLNVDELLEEVVGNFAHDENFNKVSIQKKIELEKDVISDEGLFKSILQNLVENGLKYRDPKKENQKLEIYLQNVNGHITLKVADNGIGIALEDNKKVFDMFYKINPKSSGTGLGLHILKTAVDKLGGSIELESKKGQGSTFTIKLPNEQ